MKRVLIKTEVCTCDKCGVHGNYFFVLGEFLIKEPLTFCETCYRWALHKLILAMKNTKIKGVLASVKNI